MHYGQKVQANNLIFLICSQIRGDNNQLENMFDVTGPTLAGMDTVVELTGLNLSQGQDYHIVVVAMDQSGECTLSVKKFTVDITPPIEGRLYVGDAAAYGMVFILLILLLH